MFKFTDFLREYEGYKSNLNYLKNVDKKEVDFLVTNNNKPWFVVEVKLSEQTPSSNLIYYKKKLDIPFAYQVINKKGIDIIKK